MGRMAELDRYRMDVTAFEDVASPRKVSLGGRRSKPGSTEYGRHGGAREWKLELGLFPVDPSVCLACMLPECAYEGRGPCPFVNTLRNEQAARQRERVRDRYHTDPEHRLRCIEYAKSYQRPSTEGKREKLAAEQSALKSLFLTRRSKRGRHAETAAARVTC